MPAPVSARTSVFDRRPFRWLAVVLGVWAALWLVAWLGLPPLMRWQLQAQLEKLLDRPVAVQAVRFHPWSMALTVEGLSIGQPANAAASGSTPGPEPVLSVQRLYLDVELQSLLRWAPVVDALRVEGLSAHVRHIGEGRYDIDDIVERLKRPDDQPDTPMPRFAVFNIGIDATELTLVDEPVGVTHRLQDLNLRVPFLSNLGARREVATEPRLHFVLNGQRFDSQASSMPFAESHATEASLQIRQMDLAPYLAYWPAAWSLRPARAQVDLDVRLAFVQEDVPRVTLEGRLGITDLTLLENGAGAALPLFELPRLDLVLQPSEPLLGRWHVGQLSLREPAVWLRRNPQGDLNWPRLLASLSRSTEPTDPRPADADAAMPTNSDVQFQLDRLAWQGAKVHWDDASTQPAARWTWDAIDFELSAFQWPMQAPARFQGSAAWADAPWRGSGELHTQGVSLDVSAESWPLATLRPYLAGRLQPALNGRLGVDASLEWTHADGGALEAKIKRLQLSDLRLGQERSPLASLRTLELTDTAVQWPKGAIEVGRLKLDKPELTVNRRSDGSWMAEEWLIREPASVGPSTAADQGPAPPAWALKVRKLEVRQGRIDWADAFLAEPVHLRLDGLSLDVSNLQPWARRQADMPLQLGARLLALDDAGRARTDSEAGQWQIEGQLRLPGADSAETSPMRLRTRLNAERLPLHALVPYAGPALKLEVLRADTSARGQLELGWSQSTTVRYQGDLAVDDFSAESLVPRADLLDWKGLALRGIDLEWASGAPLRLAVAETVLNDYYARIMVDENGRLNLQDLWAPVPEADAPAAVATAAASQNTAAAATPDIRFGPVSLVQGKVDFADRFIRPNYSARLTELTGSLSAFSSRRNADVAELADLTLNGRVEGTASLVITGKLNPLATPLALDIRAQVRELELPPLSPYSSKYAGHGIERGKLSMDVRYQIAPDGQLQASNQVILNQLRFADRDPSSEAPNLPVRLAVALLADRNGVIDINLPISGSINDPQFRLGPLIFKVVFNLIAKAVTAPFSLLVSALSGGSDELSTIGFEAGRTAFDTAAEKRLQAVAKAMQDRPGLSLTVVGHAGLEAEQQAYRRAQLDERLRAEKRRMQARQGAAVEGGGTISPDEYPALLKAVYQRADIPKPRNLIGMAKDLPVADMETLLMTATPVSENAIRDLALARAVQVRDRLVALEVDASRLFLAAPQVGLAPTATTAPEPSGLATARAELQLGAR